MKSLLQLIDEHDLVAERQKRKPSLSSMHCSIFDNPYVSPIPLVQAINVDGQSTHTHTGPFELSRGFLWTLASNSLGEPE